MDETLAARWSKREELIRLVESGVNIRLRQAKDFHFLARFLFSQICVKVNGKLPFLDLVLRLSVFHNTKDGWVTAGTAMDGTRKKMITIDFEPIIWMLLRINEPEMRDMLVIATSNDKLPYVGDFYTLPAPGNDLKQVMERLLDMTELSDFEGDRIERLVCRRWNTFCAVCGLPLHAVTVKGSVREGSEFNIQDSTLTIVARRPKPNDEFGKFPWGSSGDMTPKFCIYAPKRDAQASLKLDQDMLTMDFGAIGRFVYDRKDTQNPDTIKSSPVMLEVGTYYYQIFWNETSKSDIKIYSGCDPAPSGILEPYFRALDRVDYDVTSLRQCELICAAQALYPTGIVDTDPAASQNFMYLILWMYHSCAMQNSFGMSHMQQVVKGCMQYCSQKYEKSVEALTVVLMLLTLAHDRNEDLPKILSDFLTWRNGKEGWQKDLGLAQGKGQKHWLELYFDGAEKLRVPCRSITSLVREFLGLLDPEAWSSIEVEFGDEIRKIEEKMQDGLGIIRESDD